jgi:hypothetical protein
LNYRVAAAEEPMVETIPWRTISDFGWLGADDPVAAWRGRLLEAFAGLARKSPACRR